MEEKYFGIMEFEDAYYHIVKRDNELIAGSACNVGITPEIVIEWDDEIGEYGNLEKMNEVLTERSL